MLYVQKRHSIEFADNLGRIVRWYEKDYKNKFNQHHHHEEYSDLEGIAETIVSPTGIYLPRNKKWHKGRKRRLIYYRDRGHTFGKWHQVVIQIPNKWDSNKIKNHNKKAILITTQYLDKININEIQIWP